MPEKSSYKQLNADPKGKHKISYLFLGKIALFPVIMIFLAAGAVSLLTFRTGIGDEPVTNPGGGGYFYSDDLYYGLIGLTLSVICVVMLVFFLFWLVIRISFIFEPEEGKFTVYKRGIFRTSTLEFDMSNMSLHYFRTHFAENKRWLQFVVREGDLYYKLYSWRGKGTQTDTFLYLFEELQAQLEKSQHVMSIPVHPSSKYPAEIVSKEEFTLIGPFTARLKGFVARQMHESKSFPTSNITNALGGYGSMNAGYPAHGTIADYSKPGQKSGYYKQTAHRRPNRNKTLYTNIVNSAKEALERRGWASDPNSAETSICEEQIEMIDYDSILRHFRYEKRLGGPVMVGESKPSASLSPELVRRA